MMTDRPILFSAPMVRAILAGTKTQTRRALKVQPLDVLPMKGEKFGKEWVGLMTCDPKPGETIFRCKFGVPGDRLWVRENGWERPERTPKMMRDGADTWSPYYFDADGYGEADAAQFKEWGFKRRPSIHMPRWASRITLEITGIRVERLQVISDEDAIAEGMPIDDAKHDYMGLWNKINGAGSYAANPWVWCISFRRVIHA